MATLAVNGLVKRYGMSTIAVRDFTFDVGDEEMVFILGPSGAGKTTTLRSIAGLVDPDGGQIRINGHDVTNAAPRDRNVAMVYDKHSLYPHLSVYENMAYPLRIRKQTDGQIRDRVHRVADVLQIGHLLDRRPTQLSGGQMQRTAIGRALVRDADLFLMDEPISHLDAKLRAHMRVEFKKLQKDFRATILYVSHDQLEALTMADRIIVVNGGVHQQVGAPRDVYDRPANLFVATFVGEPSMNILPCRVENQGGNFHLYGNGFSIRVDETWLQTAGALNGRNRSLSLGIRPHHIHMEPASDRSEVNVLSGIVYAVETMGSERVYDLEIGGTILRAKSKTSALDYVHADIGDRACCRIDPARVYLFDADSGETLAQAQFAARQ